VNAEKYFDRLARSYTFPKKLPLFLKWNLKKILEYIPKNEKFSILDLGTGKGFLLTQAGLYNPSYDLVGIDFSQGMLDQAKENIRNEGLNALLIKSELTNLPLDDECIDFVISNNSLHHVKNKKRLYSEIYRVLKKSGRLTYSDSHDALDKEFDKAKKDWLIKDEKFAKDYKKSADSFWQSLPEEIRKAHPKEFHFPFKRIRKNILGAGFKTIRIIPSPSYFAIIYAKK
jgi:ubiquinone/menaquinone biosynthesis C-methylase UbiE